MKKRTDIYAALVKKFAAAMRQKLRDNKHRGTSWRQDDSGILHGRLLEELQELMDAIGNNASPAVVWLEAADVANFALMLADTHERDYEFS